MLNELGENLDELVNRQEVSPLEPEELRDCQEVSPEVLNQLAEPLNEVRQLLKQQKHLKTIVKRQQQNNQSSSF
ncbi:hypothetical protein [Sunxiuqinia elliptica]|uniref:hypothetical protein n=1 Tax=Sunxiuqinia elliptica TaxID=655355 RepID=UPI001060149C|nr:hypothetical protein [Sunxiuqinia elliptica]